MADEQEPSGGPTKPHWLHQARVEAKQKERLRYFSMAAAVLAGATSVIAVFVLDRTKSDDAANAAAIQLIVSVQAEKIRAEQAVEFDRKYKELLDAVTATTAGGGGGSDAPLLELRMNQLKAEVEGFNQRMTVLQTIETAVTDNPERAMSIPIMRRDLDALAKDVAEAAAASQRQTDRLVTVGMWFFGLIATVALGLFTSTLASSRKSSAPGKDA